MAVDDNAWALATGPQGQTFQFHVSSTEWKNEFSFEAYTRRRKYHWSGLGRSYGAETLTIFKMKPEMGPPDVERRDYPADDRSWFEENTNFISAVEGKTQAWGTVTDALASLRVVRDIYSLSAKAQARMPWPHPKSWNAV
jgi:hypothetical protein